MKRAALTAIAMAAVLLAAPTRADDSADILFWNSIRDSRNPAEFQAYLNAFPEGKFAPLARIRMQAGTAAQPAPAAPAPIATPTAAATAFARVSVDRPVFRAIDRIAVDIDARGLRDGSNHRVIVVPATIPDTIDAETLAALGTPIGAERLRLTLPPAMPGDDEVRIYTIPRFGRSFVVAARAPVTVSPAPQGAVIAGDLAREAKALGAVAFEAKYRDAPLRIAGQFLRMASRTTEPNLADLFRGDMTQTNYVIVYLGHLGTPDDGLGRSEVACLVPAEDQATLDRLASLTPGDELVVDGRGSTWGAGRGSEFVVLDPCRLAA